MKRLLLAVLWVAATTAAAFTMSERATASTHRASGCQGSTITDAAHSPTVTATADAAETKGFAIARRTMRRDLENPYYVVEFAFKSEICGDVSASLKLRLSDPRSVTLFYAAQLLTARQRTDMVMTAENAQGSKAVQTALRADKPLTVALVTRTRPRGSHTAVTRTRTFVIR